MANAVRMLSIDAVNQANSGHPGMPMGMADIATVLWHDFLKHNPNDPNWHNRDRFILSNGHGSMLQYALLHLSGYDVSLEDLRNFRQLNSNTAGHPERGHTPGVETTTGPLGQGLANAVGMALAAKMLAKQFNRTDFDLIDHYTYVFAGDGCLMEGISHEACSLAGTLGLDKLIVFYDANNISIDGDINGWYSENVAQRFQAYGWDVIADIDGHDHTAIKTAISAARSKNKPVLVICKTKIGFGSPNLVGTAKSHGAPLGPEERELVAQQLNWQEAPFVIPEDIYSAWRKDATAQQEWQELFNNYQQEHPELAQQLLRRVQQELPANWEELCANFITEMQAMDAKATRQSSNAWLNLAQPHLAELVGGSADLTGSNGTLFKNARTVSANNIAGNYISYGVREFGMAAIMNGMAAYGGIIPYGGTFLVFSDYSKNAIRMAALMGLKVIHVLTHDSIALGEDGPTHQPIEHLSALRSIPNIDTWRPADNIEVAIAWQESIAHNGPSALCLTRQKVPNNTLDAAQITKIKQGAYVVQDATDYAAIIIASGSEVGLAMDAAEKLDTAGIKVRVVSMPCMERFIRASKDYQQQVLPQGSIVFTVEAAASMPWYRFASSTEHILAIDSFGASAPASDLMEHFGFTINNLVEKIKTQLN